MSPTIWLLRKSVLGIFFLLGNGMGPDLVGLNGACGGRFGPRKKTRLVNGSGPSRRSWPAGWVRVWKNPA